MNAIVPLNIAAIRVNNNDSTNVVGGFQGSTASFDKMPWNQPGHPPPYEASTGDMIYSQLGESASGNTVNPVRFPLGVGVHLQWELPDYFKKGTQPANGSNLEFPPAPNRWLVTRFLSVYDSSTQKYGSVSTKSWVVESDYLMSALSPDQYGIIRPTISVPLPLPQAGTQPPYSSSPAYQQQPYMYMGRVVDYSAWNPAAESPNNYLPSYLALDGTPLYLTSIGFVGSYFGSYYPECCSVFGFWDNFSDVPYTGYRSLYAALQANAAVQFRATYQVTGWVNEAGSDPLAGIDDEVKKRYDQYHADCQKNNVSPELTPVDFFEQITQQEMKWTFNQNDVGCTLNPDDTIASLDFPTQTLCSGTAQEIVWNMLSNVGTTYFLISNAPAAPVGNPSVWDSQVSLAVGSSTEEAVSAILKYDMGQKTDDPNVLTNYEYLLDALQLGLLRDLENTPNKLIALEEALHNNGFSHVSEGYLWIIGAEQTNPDSVPSPNEEVTLPLKLAEQLYELNQAQKAYDMGRAALSTMRRQLFMDWTHFVKMTNAPPSPPNPPFDPYISQSNMINFLNQTGSSELQSVIDEGNAVGITSYNVDPNSGAVVSINKPPTGVLPTSLAYEVYNNYQIVVNALQEYPTWQLQCTKAPDFYLPGEPVVLMEGDMMEPVARNGSGKTTFVRLSQELLSVLKIYYQSLLFEVAVGQLSGVPVISADTPMQADVQALTGEAYLITPMLSQVITTAVAALGGNNNPATSSATNFTDCLMYAQGGLSPLDTGTTPGAIPPPSPPPPPQPASLFSAVGAEGYIPSANTQIQVITPMTIEVLFTNATSNGWAPNIIGWATQTALPTFSSTRIDPFLPIFMVWTVQLFPLKWESTDANNNAIYSPTNLTDFFQLDTDAVDYQYLMNGGTAVNFTSPNQVNYGNSATMSSNSTGALVFQITSFIDNYPKDKEVDILKSIRDKYEGKNFLSQSISGFNVQQTLTSYVAQVPVEDLVQGPVKDSVTTAVATAAVSANPADNWYDFGFNNQMPYTTGYPFAPLRSGFMNIMNLEIVDVFGQRMDLSTPGQVLNGPLQVTTAYSMSPLPDDTANQGKIYLPPRVLTPSRLWFQWLSATYDPSVAGITGDFPEMSTHPATSPVCGWIMPNHLDNDLFFYDSDGTPIGSFGIEHQGTLPTLKYRTRAGNTANPSSGLGVDIGEPGSPTVNPSLANYMWYIYGTSATYLQELMTVILRSAEFINPANYSQDASLSVLIGRPLALVRAVAGLETAGNVLPISQADTGEGSPLAQDVNNMRVEYTERMEYSSANLGNVNFPLRLGDLANLDDGLIGYLIEGTGSNPYIGSTFYAPAAESDMTGGIQPPTETTLQLTLNATPVNLTFLVDPRAAVHATTGILPVNELSIPPDQYSEAMDSLSVNFVTRPMLKMSQGFMVPLPAEAGYTWSWITAGSSTTTPLTPNAANETPVYGYSPQTLQEGWVELTPDPDSNQ